MVMTLPRSVDVDRFHEDLVPLLASGRGAAGARAIGARRSLTLVVDDRAYTYESDGAALHVRAGDTGTVAVAMDEAAFSDFANEMWSVFGLMYSNRVRVVRGGFDHLAAWEPVLQSAWFDRPIYGPDTVAALVDRDGSPLDLTRSFTLDDHDADIGHFLRTAGFALVKGVFSSDEIEHMSAVVEREKAKATPDDKKSWWATNADGQEVCCRVTYLAQRDRVFGDLPDDARLTRLAALVGVPMQVCTDRIDGMGVVIKNPSITQGLSDLPWHRDCGMGGHFVLCPGLNMGIQLDRADAANGQLWFLAGSHRHATQNLDFGATDGMPVVAVDTEPGDLTIHYGHVLHVAPPPTSPTAGRRAVYVGWHVPELFDIVGPGQAYNDVLFEHGDGRVRSVAEAAG
jgi:hypothetical protein